METMETTQAQVLEAGSATSGEHELRLERLLDAPRELVWAAWTEDEHLSRWCVPHGFSITHSEGEVRQGQPWRTCMRSPEGTAFWMGGVYREVKPIERLSMTHAWDDHENGQDGHETLVTITLSEEGSKTRMVFLQQFLLSEESRQDHESGWSESFERLDSFLEREMKSTSASTSTSRNGALEISTQGEREIVMARTFHAPLGLVWEAFTRPEHLSRWWGVWGGMEMELCEMDFRVGGSYRFVLRGPDGAEWGFRGEYREIAPPDKMALSFEFEGAPGHICEETFFFSERDGKTTLRAVCHYATPEDRNEMLASGMAEGASKSYDRLAEILAEQLTKSLTAA